MGEAQARIDDAPVTCVGRQAILDAAGKVVGYELLYRDSSRARTAGVIDDMAATATVVLNTVAEHGLSAVVGETDMYLNCSREVLDLDLARLLPPGRVVLELLESVRVDRSLRGLLRDLRGEGFRLALDDYVPSDPRRELVPEVDLVKVDLMATGAAQLDAVVSELKGFGKTLLAEKVEDDGEFERCRALGFELFQGYYFCKPTVLAKRSSPEDRGNIVRILSEIQRADITVEKAVELIRQDVSVTYRLLKCLNSVVFGLKHPVESLHQALVLLGMPRVRAWISLMGLSMAKGKSSEVMRLALVRGSMCQELARQRRLADPDVMFTIGLLSVLDAVLDMPMEEVLAELPVSHTIRDALLSREGVEGSVLGSVLCYERGEFASAVAPAQRIDLDALGTAWLMAVAWADKTASALLGH